MMAQAQVPAQVPDLTQRLQALDAQHSFIVQAPAGSGKTELLIQRYLVLLSRVEQPEEIAAITFTRKSAAEMRRRVLQALAEATGPEPPPEPHRALTWKHARAALQRDAALGWRLEHNAARLRIQTIDALCASLTRQMPVLASFGAQPQSVDDASLLYREAAQATLDLLEDHRGYSDDLARLLAHLDNNVATALDLLVSMLARRDQWLRAVVRGLDREQMEIGLQAERMAAVKGVECLFHKPGHASPIQGDGDAASMWQQLTEELLTQKGGWRKRNGAAQALAEGEDSEALRKALHGLRRLPPAHYTDAQWEALGAIARLLPVAVAQLKLVFAAHGQADFAEIAQGALAALGGPEAPTDLLLSLDYRIQHILVDEFQDTSFTQYQLLQRLTAGWQAGDGRTLFLVGDPMQSIYRFREADVSLFLRARREGLGSVELEPLTLSANFRSQADIVAWVNDSFARVLPGDEDLSAGAVPYAPSQAVNPAQADGVSVHAFFNGDDHAQAERIATLVASARSQAPDDTIAVLVRSRAHLEAIVPQLRQSGLRFRAIEIEPLGHRQVVQDLLALTRALSHPADRVAWLAVLRAPWCGLSLSDLHALVETSCLGDEGRTPIKNTQDFFPETLPGSAPSPNAAIKPDRRTVWELMHDATRLARLDVDGLARLERSRAILDRAMAQRLRGSLRERIENAWLALGGPACVEDDTDLEDAEIYLDYLESAEEAGELSDPQSFEDGIDKLYALPDLYAEPGDVQLLTIHKAKGLEFDTVIVPGLGSTPRHRDPSLLQWMERPGDKGQSRLLLAPIKEAGSSKDPIYDYLVCLDEEKDSHEVARLLYVAATRAKKQLHLLGGTCSAECDGEPALKPPASGSLLEKLWPVLEPQFEERLRLSPLAGGGGSAAAEAVIDQRLRRLPLDWKLPQLPPGLSWAAPQQPAHLEGAIEFSWAGETARHVGSVVHRWLQRVAEDRLEGWDRRRIESLRDFVRKELACRGIPQDALSQAVERVIEALANSIEDDRGRWLLGPKADARSELRISSLIDGRRAMVVIDRVFTGEDGMRWIVDYKTSVHEGADREGFLDSERERYRPQLERYAKILGGKACALGLYFPLLTGWREWRRL